MTILVHPHACGAYPHNHHTEILATRFIPTHVGHILKRVRSSLLTPVHPHACGAYMMARSQMQTACGSSPRMWGICTCQHATQDGRTVHPHACGAYCSYTTDKCWDTGSSPRMWGICYIRVALHVIQRFIPTHVGHILFTAEQGFKHAVHPHACGAYVGVYSITGPS